MDDSPVKIILASASPRRSELLGSLGVNFEVMNTSVDELDDHPQGPEALVRHNAQLKADKAVEQFPARPVIAADTTVSIDGNILNKPADHSEAASMLRQLSGRAHHVYTGVVFEWRDRNIFWSHCERSTVYFLRLSDERITEYIQRVNPLDKAGGYGVQELREWIIERLEGSFSNVMGLPLECLRSRLERYKLLP